MSEPKFDKGYARRKLALVLRDLNDYTAAEFWREISRIASGATGLPSAEQLQAHAKELEAINLGLTKTLLEDESEKARLVEALESIAMLPIDPCSTENDYRLSAAKAIASAAISAHRKQGGSV